MYKRIYLAMFLLLGLGIYQVSYADKSVCDEYDIHCAYETNSHTSYPMGKYVNFTVSPLGVGATVCLPLNSGVSITKESIDKYHYPMGDITETFSQCDNANCEHSVVLLVDKFKLSQSGPGQYVADPRYAQFTIDKNFGQDCQAGSEDIAKLNRIFVSTTIQK